MAGFMRKASLKMRESARDLADIADGKSSKDKDKVVDKGSKPPKARSASTANSIVLDEEGDAIVEPTRKRRESITKMGKKRLTSLFSSSSLASPSDRKDRERSSSPAVHSSPLNQSVSSSGATTPTRTGSSVAATLVSNNKNNHTLSGKGQPPHPEDLRQRVEGISLADNGIPGRVQGAGHVSEASTSSSLTTSPPVALATEPNGSPGRQRAESLFSQWDLDELSDDDDDAGFFTPTEGLSDIGEGDEDEEPRTAGSRPVIAGGAISASPTEAAPAVALTTGAAVVPPATETPSLPTASSMDKTPQVGSGDIAINPALDENNVEKGATASSGDILGTGPSTIRRTKPVQSTTRVKPRSTTKMGALSFDQEKALGPDVDTTREVLRRFLTSQMKEAEDLCFEADPEGNHLYLQSAHGYIQGLKGMMTFDANDLANALEICRNIHITATALRKPGEGLMSRVGGLVRSGAGVQRVKQMTLIEKHAELVYAESSLMKAMLGIIAGGDWMGLIREALNMRTAHGVYHTLQQFIDQSDKDGYDEDIDMDFRSGVQLGTGASSLVLSLLPGKVLKIAEVFGYAGDRTVALNTLMTSGGWSTTSEKPAHDERDEGLRRPVCDLILLAFHLVISLLMPVAGVDIDMARKILDYNNRRYPDGIFFLYFTARLHTAQCEPEKAIACLQRALDLQLEYVQLQHMCLWDFALDYMMINNWKGALDCFSILREESNWSRAVYTYSTAASLVELVADDHPGATLAEADRLMKTVKGLTRKMAGKSLPIEKLCVRKTRKFESQGQYLFLPGMELAYVFGALYHCPRKTLLGVHLPRIDRQLAKLEAMGEEAYGSGYWDDYCLGQFLRGVCLAVARYQPADAAPEARAVSEGEPADGEIDRMAEEALVAVVENGPKVQLDHYILYHNHFELGKLYARRGDAVKAQKQFDHVMNGKLAHPNQYEAKSQGKYSLEGALLLKTHSAIQALKEGRTPA